MFDREVMRQDLEKFFQRKKEERKEDGYAYCAGYFQSTLVDALEELSRHDEWRAQQILNRFRA
jgi:hypothetical protein